MRAEFGFGLGIVGFGSFGQPFPRHREFFLFGFTGAQLGHPPLQPGNVAFQRDRVEVRGTGQVLTGNRGQAFDRFKFFGHIFRPDSSEFQEGLDDGQTFRAGNGKRFLGGNQIEEARLVGGIGLAAQGQRGTQTDQALFRLLERGNGLLRRRAAGTNGSAEERPSPGRAVERLDDWAEDR